MATGSGRHQCLRLQRNPPAKDREPRETAPAELPGYRRQRAGPLRCPRWCRAWHVSGSP